MKDIIISRESARLCVSVRFTRAVASLVRKFRGKFLMKSLLGFFIGHPREGIRFVGFSQRRKKIKLNTMLRHTSLIKRFSRSLGCRILDRSYFDLSTLLGHLLAPNATRQLCSFALCNYNWPCIRSRSRSSKQRRSAMHDDTRHGACYLPIYFHKNTIGT